MNSYKNNNDLQNIFETNRAYGITNTLSMNKQPPTKNISLINRLNNKSSINVYSSQNLSELVSARQASNEQIRIQNVTKN